ncbi:sensor histidine kinase [Nesterenkonia ebinurensis]|uniref:sensor histidine kinase n=1 Tax=Nesterenkonia ebinurensis TaxID=2608252 RepID=UPI00123C8CCD|nr:HAMP domain-containing sensor histidine kinase [Nesterenkonia ebinurensis]
MRRRWPLRRQLAVIVVVMTVAAVLVIGTVSVITQRTGLINRLDDQLQITLDAASRDALPNPVPPWSGSAPEGAAEPAPNWQEGPEVGPQLGGLTVVADASRPVAAQQIRAEYVDPETGEVHDLDDDQVHRLLAEAGTAAAPTTVDLGEEGTFRVSARTVEESITVVAGQSMAQVDRTVGEQVTVFALVAAATLSITLAITLTLIRRGLRPLRRLSQVSGQVAATPLASGEVSLQRVPEAVTDSSTEIGQVGEAFNTMLAHVENALQTRESSEQRLRQFIADASHELRTPLAAVSGYAELAHGAVEAPGQQAQGQQHTVKDSLLRIRSASSRMSLMVEDLLLLARLDAGVPLRSEPVPLAGLLAEACSDAQVTSGDHRWVLDLPEDAAEVTVTGDPDRLYQVLANLLTNARSHTPAGTEVTLSLSAGQDWTEVIVHDDGPGIENSRIGRIFDRFYRGDPSRGQAAGSSGLGLAIVKAIVSAHGGQVSVSSRPGSTSFLVRLPRRRG